MKNRVLLIAIILIATITLSLIDKPAKLTSNFVKGAPEIASVNALAFGPEGILFIGDSKTATVFALNTKDAQAVASAEPIEMQGVDLKIAAALGTSIDNINIQDMAVNPVSKTPYFAVHHSDGSPVLLKLVKNQFEAVNLQSIGYSSISIDNVVAEDAKDQRGRELRKWTVSDLGYYDGQVMMSGLSNQEFGSTFRSIPFPFNNEQEQSSLEIYHAAHGQYETHAPIKTFTATKIEGKSYLVASYTCTPLVLFPLSELEPGKHVKGRTVAELGSGNSPLDMISMEKDGKSYLLLSNSNRPVMKIDYADIEKFQDSLTEPVEEFAATDGVGYVNFPLVNVVQMDKLDDSQFIMLQRKANGSLDLRTAGSRWL